MKLYQYPKCSTCRKAVKFLNHNNIDYQSIDITENPPTETELRAMLACYEGNIRKLFNTSGVQYRELKLKDSLPSMSSSQAIDLLAGNGKLIKRPFLISADGKGTVGFNEDLWRSLV
ncbi:MAG: arsenate reductase family protein [Arenicella sp.]|nr:arsenate reductase family protein [Arenicella sp.]